MAPLGQWWDLQVEPKLTWMMGKWTSKVEGMETKQASAVVCGSSSRVGCWSPTQHTHGWTKVGYLQELTHLAVMLLLERPRCLSNKGTMRYSV